MNHTTDNTTFLDCAFAFFPINPAARIHAVFNIRIVVNALTCPFIILLNILVIVAVKSKRQLRTKSNIALACLATTDLVVGLVVQPLQIARDSFQLKNQGNNFCTLTKVQIIASNKCLAASFYHLLLMSAERYLAIKHPFTYENKVTEVRIILGSGLAWAAAIALSKDNVLMTETHFATRLAVFIIPVILFFPAMLYFNVAVYNEVRRSQKQIAANQVSLEAKEKILKDKKAFYTTTIVLLVIFLCYIPTNIGVAILISFKDSFPANAGNVTLSLVALLPILNSLFNPLIYAVRIKYFRVAFIQLLSRKTIAQAEELERKIFGPRQTGVIANAVEQGQNGESREEDEQRGNETLNNGHSTTMRTQPQL